MKQASTKIKTHIQNVNIMNNNIEVGQVILRTMLSIFGALALCYVLILGNMVANIVQRKNLEKEALALSNEVNNLELSYLSVSNSVNLPLSISMGFKEAKATFAVRKGLGVNITSDSLDNVKLANNEI